MIRTQIQLDEDDMERVRRAAARRGCSVASFVRESVKSSLDQTEKDDRIHLAKEVAGRYRSGLGDLSRNHDAYLDHGW